MGSVVEDEREGGRGGARAARLYRCGDCLRKTGASSRSDGKAALTSVRNFPDPGAWTPRGTPSFLGLPHPRPILPSRRQGSTHVRGAWRDEFGVGRAGSGKLVMPRVGWGREAALKRRKDAQGVRAEGALFSCLGPTLLPPLPGPHFPPPLLVT